MIYIFIGLVQKRVSSEFFVVVCEFVWYCGFWGSDVSSFEPFSTCEMVVFVVVCVGVVFAEHVGFSCKVSNLSDVNYGESEAAPHAFTVLSATHAPGCFFPFLTGLVLVVLAVWCFAEVVWVVCVDVSSVSHLDEESSESGSEADPLCEFFSCVDFFGVDVVGE